MNNNPPLPTRVNPLVVVAGTVLAALAAVLGLVYVPAERDERPAYLATAVLRPDDPRGDVNIEVYKDRRARVVQPEYGKTGHANVPDWTADTGPVPAGRVPFAPSMGWDVSFMAPVARGERPLRFCAGERRVYDAAHGTDTAAIGIGAVRAVFDAAFEVQPSVEDCGRPDIVLGANAGQDCGIGSNAWGCAAQQYRARPEGWDAYVRVTFNGDEVVNGGMPLAAVQGVDWHELKHAGDLAHTGHYGAEGRAHAHPTDLSGICWGTLRACDNPNAYPALEDWLAEDGHVLRYRLRPRGQSPDPQPTPHGTPGPSAAPTVQPAAITKQRVLEIAAGMYWEHIRARDTAASFDEAVASDLRAGGASDVYWALDAALPGAVPAVITPPVRRGQ